MYGEKKVLDIHAHVSAPSHSTQALALMLASNTPIDFDPRTGEKDRKSVV